MVMNNGNGQSTDKSDLIRCQIPPPRGGGGGGSLLLEVVPDARESPSKKHPKQGFNGIPKYTLNKSHGPISTS